MECDKGDSRMYGLYQIMYFTLIDILNTLLSPFFAALFLFIFFQYYKIEKESISGTFSPYKSLIKTINSSLFGLLGGFITTVLFIYLEVSLVPLDFIYIIVLSIVLSMIDTRYVCIAYSGSILVISSKLFHFPFGITEDAMLIVATLHLVESILIMINGNKGRTSTYFERGSDIAGGFSINRFWPIPFVIFIGDGLIRPITLMAILAYGDYTFSFVRRKTIFSSLVLLIYSIGLLILIKLKADSLIPPIFAILGHEFIIFINHILEKKRMPVFSSTDSGVRVLEVNKDGIAKELGISPGDIIVSINDCYIKDDRDLIELQYFKMKTMRVKFLSRRKGIMTKTYNGYKKALGITIVPKAKYY